MTPGTLPASDADYEAIEAAVMETARGRWFLSEFSKRNRQADTNEVLTALGRVEDLLRKEQAVQSTDRLRAEILEWADTIAQKKPEVAALEADPLVRALCQSDANGQFDSILGAAERAHSDLLSVAERIRAIASTLREHGVPDQLAADLEDKSTGITAACSIQNIANRRTRHLIETVDYLEDRINAIIGICDHDRRDHGVSPALLAAGQPASVNETVTDCPSATDDEVVTKSESPDEPDLECGLALVELAPSDDLPSTKDREANTDVSNSGSGTDQVGAETVSIELWEPEHVNLATPSQMDEGDPLTAPPSDTHAIAAAASLPPEEHWMSFNERSNESPPAAKFTDPAEEDPHKPAQATMPRPMTARVTSSPTQPPLAAKRRSDPLAAVKALGYEEKIALFT